MATKKKPSSKESSFFDLQKRTSRIFIIGGTLLFTLGIASFVVAHWNELSPRTKVAIATGVMALLYAVGTYVLHVLKKTFAGKALIFLGLVSYGAALTLAYASSSAYFRTPFLLFLWAIGGLLTLLICQSRSILIPLALGLTFTVIVPFYANFLIFKTSNLTLVCALFYCLGLLYKKNGLETLSTLCARWAGTLFATLVVVMTFPCAIKALEISEWLWLEIDWLTMTHFMVPLFIGFCAIALLAGIKKAFTNTSAFCLGGMIGFGGLLWTVRLFPLLYGNTLTLWGAVLVTIFGALVTYGLILLLRHTKFSSSENPFIFLFTTFLLILFFLWTFTFAGKGFSEFPNIYFHSFLILLIALMCSCSLYSHLKDMSYYLEAFVSLGICTLLFLTFALPQTFFESFTQYRLWNSFSPLFVFCGVIITSLIYSIRNNINILAQRYKNAHFLFLLTVIFISTSLYATLHTINFYDKGPLFPLFSALMGILLLCNALLFSEESKSPVVFTLAGILTFLPFILFKSVLLPCHLVKVCILITLFLFGTTLRHFKMPSLHRFFIGTSIALFGAGILFLSTRSGLHAFEGWITTPLTSHPLTHFYTLIPLLSLAAYYLVKSLRAATIATIEIFTLIIIAAGTIASTVPQEQILFAGLQLTSVGFFWAVTFNVLLFTLLMGTILIGYKLRSISLINTGSAFLFIVIILKYFSWFFSSLSKTVFFMISGLILLIVGYSMEKGRAYLLESLMKRIRKK